MNFALTDEQEFLRETARGALSRVDTLEEAREALEGGSPTDLWPTACEAGWAGLLIADEHGGAGLGAMEAMLVFEELGRVLAAVPLLGHLPATALLDRAGADPALLADLSTGERRATFVAAKPPSDLDVGWTVEPERGLGRMAAPEIAGDGTVAGTVNWVPDAPGADVLVVVGEDGRAALVQAADAKVEPLWRYDATRSLGRVAFDGAPGEVLAELDDDDVAAAWYLASALLAAESLGVSEVALQTSVQYAKERFTFGRAIGSYQAIKHALVEILRLSDNARSLMYYTGWAAADTQGTSSSGRGKPSAELAVAASAFRLAAGKAVEYATRAQINVHGGIGATWEHDAPLYFRRAQLSRRLLGGTEGAADRVADELFATARAGAQLTEAPAVAVAEEAGATLGS